MPAEFAHTALGPHGEDSHSSTSAFPAKAKYGVDVIHNNTYNYTLEKAGVRHSLCYYVHSVAIILLKLGGSSCKKYAGSTYAYE